MSSISSKLDAVIVKPGSQKALYQNLSVFQLTAIEPPLWAALLAGYLRSKGYGVGILDAEAEGLDHLQTAERIVEMAPRLVVMSVSGTNPSASTMNMTGAGAILENLSDLCPEISTAMTGLHVSALPRQTIAEEKTDYVCQGEGFYTLPLLIDAIRTGGRLNDIPGLWYRKEENIVQNPPAPLMENLGDLPIPAWDMLPMSQYRAHNWHCFDDLEARSPYGVIYTSLGCPFKCSFCCINALFGTSGIRLRSPESVIEEIDLLVNLYAIKNIKIIDEMFALNKRHVRAICNLIIERGYDLNIWAYARVNTVDAQMLEKMKQAGINWVAYGFESGSEQVLQKVSKGYPREMAFEVAKMTRRAGIYINGNYIFGLPDDDGESMQKTLDMAVEINSEWANLYSTMAYPGSKLYETAVKKGTLLPATWADYSQYSYGSTPLPTKHLTSADVVRFRDIAFNTYYSRPEYLGLITSTFGEATASQIRAMTEKTLLRKGN